MAKGKPMTADAKERLRAVAAAKKGRATLAGLDVEGFSAALDAVQDGDPRAAFPLPSALLPDDLLNPAYLPEMRYTFSRSERRCDAASKQKTMPPSRFGRTVTHVKLCFATDFQRAAVRRWLGEAVIPAAEMYYAGPAAGRQWRAFWLYPAAPLVKLIYAIWPNPGDAWEQKVRKYLHGYTAAIVRSMNPVPVRELVGVPADMRAAIADRVHQRCVDSLCARGLMYDYDPKKR